MCASERVFWYVVSKIRKVVKMNTYPLTSLITLSLVALGWWLAMRVFKARSEFADPATNAALFHSPQLYSDRNFMIAYRNQMNFLENLILFLPTMWIFAYNVSDGLAALIGFGYVTGRVLYARNYPRDYSHARGFQIGLVCFLFLLVGAAGSTVYSLLPN